MSNRNADALLAVLLLLSGQAGSAVLENDHYRVVIAEDWEGTHPPGSLIEFSALAGATGDVLDGMAYAGKVLAGNYTLAPGAYEALSDTEGIYISPWLTGGGNPLPARVSFQYHLTEQGLNIAWRVDCDADVAFNSGLHWCWDLTPWLTLQGYNQVGRTDSFAVEALPGSMTRALKNAWRLGRIENCLWILQPDPLQARWNLSQSALKQEWLYSRPPNTTFPVSQFPQIASTLNPQHSIWGDISLEIGSYSSALPGAAEGWMFLSGLPEKAEQGFMYMWDAFPLSGDNSWNPLTTPNNPLTPVGSKIVGLFENHPKMKQVLLLAVDSQLSGYPFRPGVPYWNVPQSFVCIDTLDQVEGNGALTVSHYILDTTWVTQTVSCTPQETLHLSAWIRVDSLDSGLAGITLSGDSTGIALPNFIFTSAQSWTHCEADINTGPNDSIIVQAGMTGGPGKARFDDLHLERSGIPGNLLHNAGFNNFTFYMTWDGEGLQWWHAHAGRRLPVCAPQPYLDWLKFIESDSVQYGWEDRACLGVHQYHHTPNELYPLGGQYTHEFNYYDPDGDSARFYMIHRDLMDSGLSDACFKVFRFPGHKHQLPAVVECAKYGVSIIDRGFDYNGNCFLGPIILPEGVVWEVNTGWWSDLSNWSNFAIMYTVLDRGELVLAGGHPGSTFPVDNPAQFEVIDGVFNDLEAHYPNLQYFFPAAFAQFCEESRGWWDVESVNSPTDFELRFYGSAAHGQTAVAHLENPGSILWPPLVDGTPAAGEIRGSRIFIELPELPMGSHTVELAKSLGIPPPSPVPATVQLGLPFPNPCNAWLIFPLDLPRAARVEYRLTDVLGRVTREGQYSGAAGLQRISLNVESLPSGIYIFQIQSGDAVKKGKISILK